MPPSPDVTGLLVRWRGGDRAALDQLVTALYEPLRSLARSRLAGERADHTLNTGALVHEAFVRLVDMNRVRWQDRAHFLAVASRVMRRILIDYALQRRTQKRGGGSPRVSFDEEAVLSTAQAETLLELDDVLERLTAEHPRQAQAVELYYLGGLTQEEVAAALEVSQPTVQRDLQFGQAWLTRAWKGDLSRWRQ